MTQEDIVQLEDHYRNSSDRSEAEEYESGGQVCRDKVARRVDEAELLRLVQDEAMQLPDMDIAISGMAGRFPKSDSMNEFEENLRNGVDMVQDNDNTRFTCGLWGLPPRAGRLNDLSRFDYEFFGFTIEEAHYVDYQLRILYEVVYESILDSGVNPADLRGTKTGVFFGLHCNEFENAMADEPGFKSNGYYAQFAAKVAQYFDFRGLTITFDAACASGFVGFHNAVQAIDEGIVEQAVVCSSNIPIHPTGSFIFLQMQMLSPTGYSRFLDSKADGYVKSEACVSVFLQRKSSAFRNYASIMATSTSVDGYKAEGITFPSDKSQERLIRSTKELAGLSMNHIEYLEAHGTGTPAGDPQEASAISSVYIPALGGADTKEEAKAADTSDEANERRLIGPLLVGSVKTNMGHSEAASGLCALAKVALMLENEIIYRSLHFDHPNANIESLMDGRLRFVDENMPLKAKIVPLSCYGFGGANVHAIVRASEMPTIDAAQASTEVPRPSLRLVVMFGRGERPLNEFFDRMLSTGNRNTRHCLSEDFLALVDRLSSNNIDRLMSWRGYVLVDSSAGQVERKLAEIKLAKRKDSDASQQVADVGRRVHLQEHARRECALLFPGMGSEWTGMAEGLSDLAHFWPTIKRLNDLLEGQVNLIECLTSSDGALLKSMAGKFVAITAYQVALVNMLQKHLKVRELKHFVGHSLGEIACAYAAGVFDEREAIMVAFQLGKTLDENQTQIAGKMVALSMSEAEVETLIKDKLRGYDAATSTVRVCCVNGPNSVTVSGRSADMDWLCGELRRLSIDFYLVNDSFALHNETVMGPSMRAKLKRALERVLLPLTDFDRSNTGWISTSNGPSQANADYFAANLCSPVGLLGALMQLPSSSIVLETGPSGIFGGQVRQIWTDSAPDERRRSCSNGMAATDKRSNSQPDEEQPINRFHYVKLMDKNVDAKHQAAKLMSSIGDMYLSGAIFDLQHFYNGPLSSTSPRRPRQVRRQTPSLSSLFKWNHEHKLFVPRYPLQFSKSSAKCEIPVDIVQDRDKFFIGHCIEGRILFPATGYLLMIWRVFSFTKRKIYDACFHDVERELVPIEFRNVRLMRAVILGNRVAQIYIQYEEATGKFEIKEGGSIVCEGYAFSPTEKPDALLYENVRARIESEQLALELNSDDIYKQFRVSGYDYGETFRNIEACSMDGRRCRVKFNGYFIALTDSILQSIFLAIAEYAPSGGLFLPTRFEYVRFQPDIILRKMREAEMAFDLADGSLSTKEKRDVMTRMMQRESGIVDKNQAADEQENGYSDDDSDQDDESESTAKGAQKECVFETYCDPHTGVIITDGIEMKGIKATPAPRRQDTNEVLLESYQFVADEEVPVRDERLTRHETEVEPYSRVCNAISLDVLGKFTDLNGLCKLQPQSANVVGERVCSSTIVDEYKQSHLACRAADAAEKEPAQETTSQTVGDCIRANGSRTLLTVLDVLSARANLTRDMVQELVSGNKHYLAQDLIQASFSCERFVRPIVESVMENCCTKKLKLKLLEINEGDGLLCGDLQHLITSIEPAITLDYNLAHPNLQRLSDAKLLANQQKQTVKTHNLKSLPQLFSDKQLKSMDLIVYKDVSCYELPESLSGSHEPNSASELLLNLYNSIPVNRYVLVLMRSSLTLAERILMYLQSGRCEQTDRAATSAKSPNLDWINKGLTLRYESLLKEVEANSGLSCLAKKSDPNGCTMVLLKRLPSATVSADSSAPAANRKPIFLRITHDSENAIDEWLSVLKRNFDRRVTKSDEEDKSGSSPDADERAARAEEPHKVWLCAIATRQKPVSGLVGMMQALRKEVGSDLLRCYYDQSSFKDTDEPITIEQVVASERFQEALRRDQIWFCVDEYGRVGSYRHLTVNSYLSNENFFCSAKQTQQVARTQQAAQHETTSANKVRGAFVNSATRGDLSSFTWFEAPFAYLDSVEHEQIVRVAYSALNFRDIMLATGRLPLDAIPSSFAFADCLLGLEFSGVDWTGKRLMGMVYGRGIATHLLCPPERAIKLEVPSWLSLAEAATIPVVYATAIMAIVSRGRARRGESILVHAGSGGVGQAAIRLAAHLGLEIYTTVGSDEKRAFLLDEFAGLISADHIFNSRDTAFESQIKRATKGRGVDMVLNSLADDKLQASIRCLADGGRFLEIGKYDMSVDSRVELYLMDTNKTFHGILLDKVFDVDDANAHFKNQLNQIIGIMRSGLDERTGFIKPIKYTTFKRDQVEQAFRYMATGKHMGKVLIEIEPSFEAGLSPGAGERLPACVPRFQLSPHKSYIVTGGLGGFGLELIKWLVNTAGARRLIITSRSGVRTGYQRATLRRLELQSGAKILVVDQRTADATEYVGARKLIQLAADFAATTSESVHKQIGGVFHLAMVLKDTLLENMSASDFELVCRPKVDTCVHLDRLSRELNLGLDYFVAFSSVTSGKGNAGQVNYAYANSCIERVCERRRAHGLHGLAIQWGAIGDVGVAFENLGGNDIVIGGTMPQRMPSCYATLAKLLCSPFATVLSVLPFKRQADGAGERGDLVGAILHVLGIKDASKVSEEATLGELGLDSLMAVEIRQYIEREYDLTLNIQEIRALTIAKIREISESERPAKAASAMKSQDTGKQPVEVQSYGSLAQPVGRDASDTSNGGGGDKQNGELATGDKTKQDASATVFNKDQIGSFVPQLRLSRKEYRNLNRRCTSDAAARDGRALFFVPPIYGRFDRLRKVCKLIKRPCIGLNWTERCGRASSVEAVVDVYLDALERCEWTKGEHRCQVDLVGYSFGALIAFELMVAIQRSWLLQRTRLRPGKLILLDGSPKQMELGSDYLRSLSGKKGLRLEDKVDQLLMIYTIANVRRPTSLAKSSLSAGATSYDAELRSLQVTLKQTSDIERKVKLASEWLALRVSCSTTEHSGAEAERPASADDRWSPDSGVKLASAANDASDESSSSSSGGDGSDREDEDDEEHDDEDFKSAHSSPAERAAEIALAMEAFCRRYEIINKYKSNAILANNCTLIRAERQYLSKGKRSQRKGSRKAEKYNEDLGLSSLVSGRVRTHMMSGNHESFLSENAKEIAQIIEQTD